MTIGTILGWVLFGLIAGALGRLLHPGRDSLGWLGTMFLGICGSLLGGGLGYVLGFGRYPYEPGGMILSIIGAIVLLAMGFFSTRPRSSVA